ncbi:restriction endonuclease subunit S [Streptomyces anulatus]|uniref:restriction endonuclease subunit S n=1 Tax=Streptomyces anulatus TaxID=1892 RepID=UPI001C5EF9B3|nr:restriction endonuclease subunit S [Streptomyces anulatus]QYA93395.1 restriction endonuclease subunit S [Streptomyces anulatus]
MTTDSGTGSEPEGSGAEEGVAGELPEGWVRATLGELGEWFGGGTPSKRNSNFWTDGTIPWLSPKDMSETVLVGTQDLIHESALRSSPVKLLPAGAVAIVVRSGILERKVPVAYVPFEVTLNQDMKAVVPYRGIDGRWLAATITSQERRILAHCRKHGTTVASLEVSRLMELEIPIPPLAEQHRIVAKLDDQLAHVEVGEAALALAAAKLDDLVHAARFRCVWPTSGNSLPEGWVWGTVGNVLEGIEAGKSFTCLPRVARDGEWGVIKVSAMTWGEFREGENKALPPEREPNPSYEIRDGDILVSRANTVDYVGAPVIVRATRAKLMLSDKSLRLVPKAGVDKDWLIEVLLSRPVRSQYSAAATGTSDSMRNISQGAVRSARIPIPPQGAGQKRVAAAVSDAMRRVIPLKAPLDEQAYEARRLRNALLHAAFTGTLVPQDPDDEPASALLDRIRARRAADIKQAKPKRAPRKASQAAPETSGRPVPAGTQDTLPL